MSSSRKRSAPGRATTTPAANEAGHDQPAPKNPFPIVGIGASAGGLEAFTDLLKHLPSDTGMAFILIQHLDPKHPSQLADLLTKTTRMPVREAKQGMAIKPNHVYVIPPNANLAIANKKLRLTPQVRKLVPHLPVDFLFRSLAAEQQNLAIGVILSGMGSDGGLGLAEIKGAGGLTFAQDEESAEFSGMPLHAAGGNVDFVLSPHEIAQELARIGGDPYLRVSAKKDSEEKDAELGRGFQRILEILRACTNVDLSRYRDRTIKRRIQRRMVVHAHTKLTDYIRLLEKNRAEVQALFEDVLINVTSFFRDPELFETLKKEVFPAILKQRPPVIRIWVTACSTGQEAYSMAIALLEFLEHKADPPAIQIFATDINEAVSVEKARRGFYPSSIEGEVSPERLRRYFTKEPKGYRISKAIRELCVFAKQNITVDPPFSRMHLVSCRNLLIYFTPPLQRQVVAMFHYALNPGGFLVLGGSETVGASADMFEVHHRKQKIFSKKGMATRPFAHFRPEELKPEPLTKGRPPASYAPAMADFQREADRILLGRFAPAAVVVNSSLEILQFRGSTRRYLEQPSGPASFNLLKMAREGLPVHLGKAVQQVRDTNAPVCLTARLHSEESVRKVSLEVLPLKLPGSNERCFLILFEEAGDEQKEGKRAGQPARASKPMSEKNRELIEMRRELMSSREYLQTIVEQHNAANEEIKCANEEILSSNEELQSTNEQLGTAKEEMQSTNEELVTLNEELQTRNNELNEVNRELKHAQEKLLENVNAIVDTARGPFLMLDAALRVQKANTAFYNAFQVSPAETDNRSIYELGEGQWDVSQLRALLDEVLTSRPLLKDIEVTEVFPHIGRRVMLLNARRLEQKSGAAPLILLSIEDVTEWKQIEERSRWLAAIVESSNDAIIGEDFEGRIVSCNQGAARLYGYGVEELIGQRAAILNPPDEAHEDTQIMQRIRRDEPIKQYERVRQRKDGSRVAVLLTVSPVKDAAGKIIGASHIAHDITDRKRGEKQLEESLAREKTARESAEAANRAKDDFLAALSHELRTPLNPVLLLASEASANADLSAEVRGDFEIIRKSIELETRLIDDLLDLTRITFGKMRLNLRPGSGHAILQDAVAAVRPELDHKQIHLILNLDAPRHTVHCDAVRLQQVFWNVLKNAVKFTPRGGRITVTTEVSADQNHFIAKVTDNGIGMTAEDLERIFLAFAQGEHAKSHRFGGLGLGLAISRRLIEFHHGEISAGSEGRGKGATFTIELPLLPDKNGNDAGRKKAAPPAGENRPKGSGVRVLLVEDHEPTRLALSHLLARRQYRVISADCLAKAREIACYEKFDVVISDIGLPDGSGNDLMKELRDAHGLKGIALTGYGTEHDIALSHAAGFMAHLTKPVNVQSLEHALATLALHAA